MEKKIRVGIITVGLLLVVVLVGLPVKAKALNGDDWRYAAPASGMNYGSGPFVPSPAPSPNPVPALISDDPFYYLSVGMDKMQNNEETKHFVASWYQVLRYAAISGAVISGGACIIVWAIALDGNKRAEKRKALTRKCLYLIAICSLSSILSIVFGILDRLR